MNLKQAEAQRVKLSYEMSTLLSKPEPLEPNDHAKLQQLKKEHADVTRIIERGDFSL